ncbi:hypothetical protein J3D55_000848 [Chryseobacterium ginsenosidimutans]|uniref:hypothetical protein n=1 Tax=Chryseobacterium ginsenosidimutans TaxID=687846 RepID=UPI00216756C5|nr:hypothetical protein [Chryseobacterium ginsenosidimutans]MCS3867932.1 hypothetical protein [Chryseobacterium ginsenosidimutans]
MSLFSNVSIKSFGIAIFLFLAVCFGYYLNLVSKTDGHYVYLIDDAYIHLAMAKNFALHDVWGVTRYEFSSTSSSPLFTYLLSVLIKIFGNNDQISLYFNLILGVGIAYVLNQYFLGIFKSVKNIVSAVLFTLFFSVLHLQLLSGMEHIFHVFLFVLNIFCLSNFKNKTAVLGFYLSLLLMGLVRFESMFYFVILAFVFMLIKKWKEAFFTLAVGFVPVVIFCYFNYQHDGYLFPNSVLVKGTKLTLDSNFPNQLKSIFLDNFLFNISFYKIGFFPIIMGLIFVFRDVKKKTFNDLIKDNFLLIVISLLMICHSMFADLKGIFRYEAYILAGFSMALIPKVKGFFENFKNYIKKEKLLSGLIILNVVLLIYKCSFAHTMLNNGGKNIYEQQIQSAKFLHTYYDTSKVVANDIGAISYFTDIHLLDIVGLGSKIMIPFTENKKPIDNHFETFLSQYTINNKYDVAIIYDEWFQGHVPKNWKKAAVLKIKNPISVSRDKVSVYSINKENLLQLRQNIKKFSWNRNVQVTIVD